MRLIMSVTGKDRPGIIAGITKVCYELKGNLEDASMTILAGEFAMILLVSFPKEEVLDGLLGRLKKLQTREGLHISVQPLRGGRKGSLRPCPKATRYIISVFGKDRAGIVYKISSLLAERGLNITDLNSKLIGSKKKPVYGLLVEVDIPKGFRAGSLEKELNQFAKHFKMDVGFKPVDTLTL